MAVTAASFKVARPEFVDAEDAFITATIAQALQRIDPAIFGDETDTATIYLTAHYIAISPFGRNAKLSSKEGETVYHTLFRQIQREKAGGHHVA
jgi:hypothetical protein